MLWPLLWPARGSDLSAEVRLESVARSGTRRSLGEVYLQLGLWAESGSRRSPDGVFLKIKGEVRLP